ncbi:MAG: hypothetical protein BWX95_01949 [Bacteroidetes bacterium ADurb.Bin141]|nr:MAG: hypothetical protein BWX95_01949 [Bacteroidetes bacterium ADurb.Bin141]
MIATQFYLLKNIRGNTIDFHRKTGTFCKSGVYFWGFTLREDANLPKKSDELVIYYIGKSERNIAERLMQEVTQLLFGGFGTILDHNWLITNPYTSRIFNKQESNPLDKDVLYKSDGLHVLYDFFGNTKIKTTLDWMRERLIFAWIDTDDIINIPNLESELHHIVRTNCFGIGKIKTLSPKKDVSNLLQTPLFNQVDWSSNSILKEWLEEVNRNIP